MSGSDLCGEIDDETGSGSMANTRRRSLRLVRRRADDVTRCESLHEWKAV